MGKWFKKCRYNFRNKNIEVVSPSLNQISILKPFQNLHNIKELYLIKNNISDIKEIEFLKQCPIKNFMDWRKSFMYKKS